jgi:SIR2-like domain
MTACDEQIRQALQNIDSPERVVFFVGAGISVSAGYPLWGTASKQALQIARGIGLSAGAAAYAQEKLNKLAYYELFEILWNELTEPAYYNLAVKVFGGTNTASDIHKKLIRTRCRGIITTNFDECLVAASVLERGAPPVSDLSYAMASDQFFVVKPHGSIQLPQSMVLRTTDWKRVIGQGLFNDFIAQIISTNQVVFLGYGLGDPDFTHAWDHVLKCRVFRAPAIYCCPLGGLDGKRLSELRERKVAVIEFPDDGTAVLNNRH